MKRIVHDSLDWSQMSRRIRKEQRNRETHYPTISTYRWWARRSHYLVGALLDRSRKILGNGIVVSDPMAGGGTVAVEASRRDVAVFAQDVNPWAAAGLRTTLTPVDPKLLKDAANQLIAGLWDVSRRLYSVSGCSSGEIVTQLHVRKLGCPHCDATNFLFPTLLIALDARITARPKNGWFGCPRCGTAHQASWPKGPSRCPSCAYRFLNYVDGIRRINAHITQCADCKKEISLESRRLAAAHWHSVLSLVRHDGSFVFQSSSAPVPRKTAFSAEFLNECIPEGRETNALLRWGHGRWRDLYTQRQIAAFEAIFSQLNALRVGKDIRQRLLLAVCGLAEMPGYACRWDPKYRKVYEIGSNHHYSRVVLTAEINPLGRFGRGTLTRRLRAAVSAAHWHAGSNRAYVSCGSSSKQPIQSATVDLVITDPPYYDSVQYAELSRLFRVFMRGIGSTFADHAERDEAVPNGTLTCTHDEYIKRLSAVFAETARTVKIHGRMLLTFHHRRLIAWRAITEVLQIAGWSVISLAVVHSENEKDFAKTKKDAITSDLVIECVKRRKEKRVRVRVCRSASDGWSQNLMAIGLALAAVLNGSASDLGKQYLIETKKRGVKVMLKS